MVVVRLVVLVPVVTRLHSVEVSGFARAVLVVPPVRLENGKNERDQKEGSKRGNKKRDQKEASKGGIKKRARLSDADNTCQPGISNRGNVRHRSIARIQATPNEAHACRTGLHQVNYYD